MDVLAEGTHKHPVRFGDDGTPVPLENDTIGIFAAIFRHNMADGFPLLTSKKMPLRTIAVELEGFIKGITSKKWYQERKCKIWNEWANPVAVEKHMYRRPMRGMLSEVSIFDNAAFKKKKRDEYQIELDDLGPIYGYQWRSFNGIYDENDDGCLTQYDQFKTVCDRLRENPYDRRMVVSAWNPIQISRMALPPCHFAWNVVVYGNKLNLIWHQRSCDLMLGVPFNIASYGLLLLLLAKHANLEPGELVGTLNDCHIYGDQIEQAKAQLTRNPRELPQLTVESDDIFDWTHEDRHLENYNPHPPLEFGLTVN